MKPYIFIGVLVLMTTLFNVGYGQNQTGQSAKVISTSVIEPTASLQDLIGTWELDLRASPKDAPYRIEIVISGLTDGKLRGTFYNTPFTNGRINTEWGKVYFAFTTADGTGTYFSSGYLSDGKLYGSTYTEARGFIMPWFSIKKK